MPSPPAGDRRRHRRFELRLPVSVFGANARAALRDISEGGVFIETDEARPLGECMPLRLVHPDTGEEIPAVCQVVRHVRTSEGALHGLGLRFANIDAALNDRICELILDLAGIDPRAAEDAEKEDTDDGNPASPTGGAEDHPLLDLTPTIFELDPTPAWANPDTLGSEEDDQVDVVVVSGQIGDDEDLPPADVGPAVPPVPIIWPDSRPRKPGHAVLAEFNPMQLRLLAFVDGNNTVAQVARGAGLGLEIALQELSELAHEGTLLVPEQPTGAEELEAWADGIANGATSLFPGREEQRAQRELWRKAHALVAQGLAAERNNDFAEATQLLETALALNPPNRGNIHARLAVMAMERLHDFALAELHARAVIEAEPHRPYGERLLRQIRARQGRRVKLKRRRKTGRRRRVITQPRLLKGGRPVRAASAGRQLATLLAGLALVALLAWNLFAYFVLPAQGAPAQLEPAAISRFFAARRVLLHGDRLVVTIGTGWTTLSPLERREKVTRLADWARQHHRVGEVLIADPTPRLLARARNGSVTIFAEVGGKPTREQPAR